MIKSIQQFQANGVKKLDKVFADYSSESIGYKIILVTKTYMGMGVQGDVYVA